MEILLWPLLQRLNRRGLRTELHVAGCTPPKRRPNFVIEHGFVSKKTAEGQRLFDKLMTEAHFFILPSMAECYGIVFAEASSFGLPSLATKVGGIPTAIHDGKNGQTFPLGENPEKYSDYIERLMSSKQQYRDLSMSSYGEYINRINWSSSGKKVSSLIKELCG